MTQRGFSLIEIMVAVGMLGGLSLGVMKVIEMQSKSQKKSEMQLTKTMLMDNVKNAFESGQGCFNTLVENVGNLRDAKKNIIKIDSLRTKSNREFLNLKDHRRSPEGQGLIAIKSLHFDQDSIKITDGSLINATIIVEFVKRSKFLGTKGQTTQERINLNVHVQPDGEIIGCNDYNLLTKKEEGKMTGKCKSNEIMSGYDKDGIPICKNENATIAKKSCKKDEVMRGFDKDGNPICESGLNTKKCKKGELLQGFNGKGEPICQDINELFKERSCKPGQVVLGFSNNGKAKCADLTCPDEEVLVGIKENGEANCIKPEVDAEDISGILSNTIKIKKKMCARKGSHTLSATCPSGTYLSSCAGGAGDMFEEGEGFYVEPYFKTNTCTLFVKEPACTSDQPESYQRITAVCYKSKSKK